MRRLQRQTIWKQDEANEFCARRHKLASGTTLQVVFKRKQVNHGKPTLTVVGDLLHQKKNDRKLKQQYTTNFYQFSGKVG